MAGEIHLGAEKLSAQVQGDRKPDTRSTPRAAPAGPAAAASTSNFWFLKPPQGDGIPRRPFATGGPARAERLNVAMKVLRDPVARTSFSRVYSGQARNWSR